MKRSKRILSIILCLILSFMFMFENGLNVLAGPTDPAPPSYVSPGSTAGWNALPVFYVNNLGPRSQWAGSTDDIMYYECTKGNGGSDTHGNSYFAWAKDIWGNAKNGTVWIDSIGYQFHSQPNVYTQCWLMTGLRDYVEITPTDYIHFDTPITEQSARLAGYFFAGDTGALGSKTIDELCIEVMCAIRPEWAADIQKMQNGTSENMYCLEMSCVGFQWVAKNGHMIFEDPYMAFTAMGVDYLNMRVPNASKSKQILTAAMGNQQKWTAFWYNCKVGMTGGAFYTNTSTYAPYTSAGQQSAVGILSCSQVPAANARVLADGGYFMGRYAYCPYLVPSSPNGGCWLDLTPDGSTGHKVGDTVTWQGYGSIKDGGSLQNAFSTLLNKSSINAKIYYQLKQSSATGLSNITGINTSGTTASGVINVTSGTQLQRYLSGAQTIPFSGTAKLTQSTAKLTGDLIIVVEATVNGNTVTIPCYGVGRATGTNTASGTVATKLSVSSCTFARDDATWGASSYNEPWEFHTKYDSSAYAEIKANECKNEDWEVLAGIPSTEHLTVIGGGEIAQVDICGSMRAYGNQNTGTVNNGAGVANCGYSGGALTRKITFNVTLNNWWGDPGSQNVPCSLSCPGHSNSASWSFSISATGAGNTTTQVCSHCGETVSVTGSSHTETHGSGENATTVTVDDTVSKSHSCNLTVTYHCDTGTWEGGGSAFSSVTGSSSLRGNGQGYNGSATATSKGGDTITASASYGDLCQGYTTGMGCTHSNNLNCVHQGSYTKSFVITEYVDQYVYQSIDSWSIYGLGYNKITATNTSLISNSYVGSAASGTVKGAIWRIVENSGQANLGTRNGRVWFTQFKNPTYKNGSGWTSTSINANYFLGDAVIDIVGVVDQSVGQAASPEAIDNVTIKNDNGKSNSHFKATSNSTVTTYKNNIGDWASEAELIKQCCQMVNAWQYQNNANYQAIVISDQMCIGVESSDASGMFQNITCYAYPVQASGVPLFNCGFSPTVTSITRAHKSDRTHEQVWADIKNPENICTTSGSYSFRACDANAKLIEMGYLGNPSADYNERYKVRGDNVTGMWKTTFIGALENNYSPVFGYNSAYSKGMYWNLGSWMNTNGTTFNNVVGSATQTGVLKFYFDTSGTASTQNFAGYWNDHSYPATGNFTLSSVLGTAKTTVGTVNNSGKINMATYAGPTVGNYAQSACALVISNIDMIDTAANGKYSKPVTVKNNYVCLTQYQGANASLLQLGKRTREFTCEYYQGKGEINEIVIHDPVSVQYCYPISNGSGSYETYVEDDTNEDFRTVTAGMTEQKKDDYYVIGNDVHIWVSDFGDFYDSNGPFAIREPSNNRGTSTSGQGANPTTGQVYRNNGRRGYMNDMNCGIWTKSRYVKFPMPVSYIDTSGNRQVVQSNVWIDLSKVAVNSVNGLTSITQDSSKNYACIKDGNGKGFHYGSTALQSFMNAASQSGQSLRGECKWGADYTFTLLTSALEAKGAKVYFKVESINDTGYGSDETNKTRSAYKANGVAVKTGYIDIVGRIGNLTLEDVGDFRFSNLFKKAKDTWLINGVIKNTDITQPNTIGATEYDILGSLCGVTKFGVACNASTLQHNTLSMSTYQYGSLTMAGKAGNSFMLPLAPGDNIIDEYKTQPVRLGYNAFLDVETIGNYYGITHVADESGLPANPTYNDIANYTTGQKLIESPTSFGEIDERQYKLTILPRYFLYDYETGEVVKDISIFYGNQGSRQICYDGSTTIAADGTISMTSTIRNDNTTNLYLQMNAEQYRRNVSDNEKIFSNYVVSRLTDWRNAFDNDTDWIGNTSCIILDHDDMSLIGSNVYYGSVTYDSATNTLKRNSGDNQLNTNPGSSGYDERLSARAFGEQSQRWHFTIGLPSSAYVTYTRVGGNTLNPDNQLSVEQMHNKLYADHPNSVIVCALEIQATGEVWNLAYNYSQMNNGTKFKIFDPSYLPTIDGDPSIPIHNEVDMSTVDPSWQPTLVYDPWNTAADDLNTVGTH